MRAITKCRRAGYTKYPARKREKEKAISFSIDAEQEIVFDARIHVLAKMTQNGNYFVRGENVRYEGYYWDGWYGYVDSNMQVLRRTYPDEIEFVHGWEQPWIILPKCELYDRRLDIIVNVVSGLSGDDNDALPCDEVCRFLGKLDRRNQGASYELYMKRIAIYSKKRHWYSKFLSWLKAKSESIVICPLYLYGLKPWDVETIREYFDVTIVDENN